MYNYINQPLFQGQQMQPFGQMQQQPLQMPAQLPTMGGGMFGAPQPVQPQPGAPQHHSALHNMLPYLGFGLLGGSLLGGGGMGDLAPLFGLAGLAAKHFGVFK